MVPVSSLVLSSSYAITEWMGLGLSYVKGNAAWQIFIGLQLIAPVVMLAGSFFMHESPRYLVLKDKSDEALEVLKKMHGGVEDKTFYLREFHQIQSQLALEKSQHIDFKTIFTKQSYRFRFLLITITGAMAMLTGVIALQNYQIIMLDPLPSSRAVVLLTLSPVILLSESPTRSPLPSLVYGARFYCQQSLSEDISSIRSAVRSPSMCQWES